MIPKIIHYCWFGGNPIPENAKKCIDSWKQYCDDFVIIRWDESNFDININEYVKEAYKEKKWAFVSDYVRLHVLKEMGGIYLDTDVEVLRSLEPLLDNMAFCGFESDMSIGTAVMGFEKDNIILNDFIKTYENDHFKRKDGSLNTIANTKRLTDICISRGAVLNGSVQNLEQIIVYDSKYFFPKDVTTGKINLTPETYSIHFFDGSWLGEEDLFYQALSEKIRSIFRNKFGNYLSKFVTIWIFEGPIKALRQFVGWVKRK